MKKTLGAVLVVMLALVVASAALAADGTERGPGDNQNPGPGDNPNPAGAESIILTNPLSTSSVGGLVDNVTNWLIKLGSPVAAVMVIVGGIQILTSGGNEDSFKKGRKTILYTAIGYGIILVGSGIIKIIEAILNG